MEHNPTLIGLRGWMLDAPEPQRLRSRPDGALIVEDGRIVEVGDYLALSRIPRERPVRWHHYPRGVIFPGLVDLHSHVPQYPAVARGSSDLLPWLRQNIFPLEREFAGGRGRREAAAFFTELARQGTTTAALYTAIFEDSADAAFLAAAASGLRVIMGKMMMDIGSYGALMPSKIASISLCEAERLCAKWHGQVGGRIEYAFSPRFAVACSEKLMRGAAELADRYGCYVQTHLAENVEELDKVRQQYRWARDYTDVYAQCGVLGPRTIVGHAIHLSDRELAVLAETGTSVAHCPSANLFLRSGIMPLDRIRAAGIRVGLGSDVAAGPELNMWRVMRACIESQKARSFYEKDVAVPGVTEVLHLATLGGAEALGKAAQLGSLDTGKWADVTVMDYLSLLPYHEASPFLGKLTAEDILALCIYRGGPEAVLETFVQGNSIHRAPEPELF